MTTRLLARELGAVLECNGCDVELAERIAKRDAKLLALGAKIREGQDAQQAAG